MNEEPGSSHSDSSANAAQCLGLFDRQPFYFKTADGRVVAGQRGADVLSQLPANERTIDPCALLSVLSFEHMLHEETILESVRRVPCWSRISKQGEATEVPIPPHGTRAHTPEQVAGNVFAILRREILAFARGRRRVYLLLSGGMDSRIVATAVRSLQHDGLLEVPVESVTWGQPGSRDVHYARELSRSLGWVWHHAELTGETFARTFERTAGLVAGEVDPKHAHRWDWFETADKDAVVLAATWGDSLGRAEFSRVHVSKLTIAQPRDRYRLLRTETYEQASKELIRRRTRHICRFGKPDSVRARELEQHTSYLKRMLGNTLDLIGEFVPVGQLFTSREMTQYIFSLAPSSRDDRAYEAILRKHAPDLLRFAWARTGLAYRGSGESQDELSVGFHAYGRWLRSNLLEMLHHLLFENGALAKLEVVDEPQLRWAFRELQKERLDDDTSLATQLSWLAGLSCVTEKFDVGPARVSPPRSRLRGHRRRALARVSQVGRRISRPARMKLRDFRGRIS